MKSRRWQPILERLEAGKLVVDGHWRWSKSHRGGGYGQIAYQGKQMGVHEVSAILWLGYTPRRGVQVNHKRDCPYKDCWNPVCLYVGTQLENIKDRLTKSEIFRRAG